MSAASDYLENALANAVLRGVAFTSPTKTYISLHTASPGDTGANEVSLAAFPAYLRKDAALGAAQSAAWTAASGGQSKNALQLIYAVFDGASPITITHFGVWDALTAGNSLLNGALAASRTLNPGDVFVIDVQKLTVTVL
jgi:hypothetical protein